MRKNKKQQRLKKKITSKKQKKNLSLKENKKRSSFFSKIFSISQSSSIFRQNFIKVARANALSKALPLLATPILSRLFSPDDFATTAIFTSILGVLIPLSTWRFEWPLPNTKKKSIAISLLVTTIIVLIVTSLIITLILFTYYQNIKFINVFDYWKGFEKLGVLVFFLPIALFGTGVKSLMGGWYIKVNDLSAVSRSTIIEGFTLAGVSILTGFLGYGAFGLISAKVLSAWAGVSSLLSHEHSPQSYRVTTRRLCASFKRYRREATLSTLASTVNAASFSLPLLLFSQFYPMREVGWYSLMLSTAAGPISIISMALNQSFWGQAAYLVRENRILELKKIYLNTTKKLLLVSIPIAIICASAPLYVGMIFGKSQWDGAGYVLLAMTPMIVGGVLFSPTQHLVVFSKQSQLTIADMFRLGATASAIFLAKSLGWSFFNVVLASSIGSFIGHLILFSLHMRIYSKYR